MLLLKDLQTTIVLTSLQQRQVLFPHNFLTQLALTSNRHTPKSTSKMATTANVSEESYFASTAMSASGSSLVSTPNGSDMVTAEEFVSKAPVHPLPAMSREFIRPVDEVNVAEALAREPGRWTIHGQREANRLREREMAAVPKKEAEEARAKALQKAKADLMAAYAQMANKSDS